MKDGTALRKASSLPLPAYAHDALRYDRHPQDRTHAFHLFYNAPVHHGRPTKTFEYMSDQRVAFRASFILSEVMELLAKGLGVDTRVTFVVEDEEGEEHRWTHLTDDADLCNCIQGAMRVSRKRDIIEVADALGDLNVVVNGFALELGLDMHVVDQEVCASNFTKADTDGKPIIGDGTTGPVGKVLKGPNFMEPNLAVALGIFQEEGEQQ